MVRGRLADMIGLLKRAAVGAAILASVMSAVPPTTAALCVLLPPGADPLADAGSVFVGTVVAIANQGRWAQVQIEEVWNGPDLPATLEVRGSPAEDPNAMTSVDRTYSVGVRYLFAGEPPAPFFSDNNCSPTREWGDDLDAVRPADARQPLGDSSGNEGQPDLGGIVAPIAAALVIGLVALLAVVVVRRTQSE